MAVVISGNGIDMGGNPVSNASQVDSSLINASQVDSTVINENGNNVISQGELAYDVNTSSYIPNTLASGAIIERGNNANGDYVKFADGTIIMKITRVFSTLSYPNVGTYNLPDVTLPHLLSTASGATISYSVFIGSSIAANSTNYYLVARIPNTTIIDTDIKVFANAVGDNQIRTTYTVIGRYI